MPRISCIKVCNLWSPSSRGAAEQLGVATIDPAHLDRPEASLIADFQQVHAVKEGKFANMVNIARIAAGSARDCRSGRPR